jgi:hypothetical protein
MDGPPIKNEGSRSPPIKSEDVNYNSQPQQASSSQSQIRDNDQSHVQPSIEQDEVHQGNGFTYSGGNDIFARIYNVEDSLNIKERGYINPYTGRPYDNHQPFARNVANAMEYQFNTERHPQMDGLRDPRIKRYLDEFMAHHFPNRQEHAYRNSGPIRKLLRDLP